MEPLTTLPHEPLTLEALRRTVEAVEAEAFWAAVRAHFAVEEVYFSRHLSDVAYRLAPLDWLGQPALLVLPEVWRAQLPRCGRAWA